MHELNILFFGQRVVDLPNQQRSQEQDLPIVQLESTSATQPTSIIDVGDAPKWGNVPEIGAHVVISQREQSDLLIIQFASMPRN